MEKGLGRGHTGEWESQSPSYTHSVQRKDGFCSSPMFSVPTSVILQFSLQRNTKEVELDLQGNREGNKTCSTYQILPLVLDIHYFIWFHLFTASTAPAFWTSSIKFRTLGETQKEIHCSFRCYKWTSWVVPFIPLIFGCALAKLKL